MMKLPRNHNHQGEDPPTSITIFRLTFFPLLFQEHLNCYHLNHYHGLPRPRRETCPNGQGHTL